MSCSWCIITSVWGSSTRSSLTWSLSPVISFVVSCSWCIITSVWGGSTHSLLTWWSLSPVVSFVVSSRHGIITSVWASSESSRTNSSTMYFTFNFIFSFHATFICSDVFNIAILNICGMTPMLAVVKTWTKPVTSNSRSILISWKMANANAKTHNIFTPK